MPQHLSQQYGRLKAIASEDLGGSAVARLVSEIEICVPRQLQMFQSRVAEISRIYYLDPPQVYLALANDFPRVEVKSFGEALEELQALLCT